MAAIAIEYQNVIDFVKDSEVSLYDEKERKFDYDLNDKSAKAKLLKGAKRGPFEVIKKSCSSNLVFNVGSWNKIVLQSISYWDQVKGDKSCKVGLTTVRVASVKYGTETGGKHVDTLIVFYVNRDKVTCHFYNTTQLILVNGHGYQNLIDEFLEPYFKSKIEMNIKEIASYNEQALETLGGKTVKRASVKYKSGSTFPCNRCDFSAKTLSALGKHKKADHTLNFTASSVSSTLALPRQSTRNNSLT